MEAKNISHLSHSRVANLQYRKMNNSHKVFINSELFIQYPVVEHNKSMIEAINTEITVELQSLYRSTYFSATQAANAHIFSKITLLEK
jgi:hypothetical protein